MFEIGWTEILVVGLVAIFVLKPKDYPDAMRALGRFLNKARQMAGEFQQQFNDAMRDANLDDVRKTIDDIRDIRNMGSLNQVRETLAQIADEAAAIKSDVEAPTPATEPQAPDSAEVPSALATEAAPPLPEHPAGPPADLLPPPAPAPAAGPAAPPLMTGPAAANETHGPTKAA